MQLIGSNSTISNSSTNGTVVMQSPDSTALTTITKETGAVNRIMNVASATGSAVKSYAIGTDSTISYNIGTKGAGTINFGTRTEQHLLYSFR